ncbi:MAG: PIN domain-containing protein [Pseudomonadota bacterium]
MDKQFVDTGAFIAITDKSDQYHSKATAYFRKLLKLRHPLLTTNFVLDETYARLKRKLGSKASITFGDEIRKSDQLETIIVDREIERRAWAIFKKYQDQEFSYTDCTSFAVMEINKLKTAFAFDTHFTIFGFSIAPVV